VSPKSSTPTHPTAILALVVNMKGLYAAVAASAISGALAAPSPVVTPAPDAAAVKAACATPVTLSGNPFVSRSIFANPFYASEVSAAAAQMTDSALAAAALKVADVGTFQWM
jgi:cellulose 1,4-beta-cellobiosidase